MASKKNTGTGPLWDPAFLQKHFGIQPAPPPPGMYDPAIDYESGAANRGLTNTQDDAATQFETGTEQHNATLADLLRQSQDVQRNYTVLGHQQAGHAAQQGITSAGLLQLSADARAANEAHDLVPITAATNAENASFARTFGGFNGQVLNDPYTGQPVVGSLVTSLGRAGIENTAYQTGLAGQRTYQAQQGGYVDPYTQARATEATYRPPRPARPSTRGFNFTSGALGAGRMIG